MFQLLDSVFVIMIQNNQVLGKAELSADAKQP